MKTGCEAGKRLFYRIFCRLFTFPAIIGRQDTSRPVNSRDWLWLKPVAQEKQGAGAAPPKCHKNGINWDREGAGTAGCSTSGA